MNNITTNITTYAAKRVYALYRVSTAGQVEKNDIPMQKQRCREYAEEQGWEIIKELSEKGVSGFKRSGDDRDAIREIRQAAAENKFDILLVFMYDRIGRRQFETTAIVKELSDNGVEVWSTVEGQMRFESHTDDLLNYIQFWQAEGESMKTSMRTKTRMAQIVLEGRFRGGKCPYGYKLVKRGRMNKHNQEVYEIEVDPVEAGVVKMIFEKYTNEGYGTQRLAKYLTEHGIMNRSGKPFVNTTINHMLKNILYTGVLRNGDARSEIFPELQIVAPEMFQRVKYIMSARTMHHNDVPLSTKSDALLTGLVYCGNCGSKLVCTSSSGKDRSPRLIYQCHNHVRHPEVCIGQYSYRVNILDSIVNEAVRSMLSRMKSVPAEKLIRERYQEDTERCKAVVEKLTDEIANAEQELIAYKAEIGKAVRGQSTWDADILKELTTETQRKLTSLREQLEAAQDDLSNSNKRLEEIKRQHAEIISWADIYTTATPEAKKMIIAQLIERIDVSDGYEVNIRFRISYIQFCGLDEVEQRITA